MVVLLGNTCGHMQQLDVSLFPIITLGTLAQALVVEMVHGILLEMITSALLATRVQTGHPYFIPSTHCGPIFKEIAHFVAKMIYLFVGSLKLQQLMIWSSASVQMSAWIMKIFALK